MMRSFGASVVVAFGFLTSAGLPGLSVAKEPVRLMAMTEIKAGGHGHFVVKAQINNSSIPVLVDTGASTVALSYEDAERAGLRPKGLNYDVTVSTANGNGKAARVKLRTVRIDNIRVDNVDALVLTPGVMDGTLLGMSFLSRLRSFTVEDGRLILNN